MLSKSRFITGLQCHRLLWWTVREPHASELVVGEAQQAILDHGTRVGELARERFPGGVLIANDAHRVEATRAAIDGGARVLYEASFAAGDAFCAADVLVREDPGWRVIDVKSTTSVKPVHIADAAIQLYVLERAGLTVHGVEIMHLDPGCRHPDLDNLFVHVDVTARARDLLPAIPAQVAQQVAVLRGRLPVVPTGRHCHQPYPCPFQTRCLPALPAHHVTSLYRGGRQVDELLGQGIDSIDQITEPLEGVRERQRRAVQTGGLVVEGDLDAALIPCTAPIGALDFETVSPAVPVWPGCSPYEAVPVQFSVDVETAAGARHHEWLADGPGDPRRPLALALLDACAGASTLLAYHAPFERKVIEGLAAACPDLAPALLALAGRLFDLLPVVRDHVYHPDFEGSFSLKAVLPALTGRGYEDLAIAGGSLASTRLERLLFQPLPPEEREGLRRDLLAYCARDTSGLVLLLKRLREIAAALP